MRKSIMLLGVMFLFCSCSSNYVTVMPKSPEKFQRLGPVSGSSCGFLGLLATAYYFVPIGINDRVQNAYDEAVSKVPGAKALVDVTLQDDWYWIVLGTLRCSTITGEAVK